MRVAQDLLKLTEREERDLFKRTRCWLDRGKLRQIVTGKVKTVDVDWWRKIHGVTRQQVTAKQDKDFRKRLDAIKAMADPIGNPNEHQRRMAEEMLAKVQAAGPKVVQIRPAPGLEEYDREEARMRAVNDQYMARMTEAIKRYRASPAFEELRRRAAATHARPATDSVAPRSARQATDSVAPSRTARPTPDSVAGGAKQATTDSVAPSEPAARPARQATDSVAGARRSTDSVATDSVAQDWLARRAAQRAEKRANLKCLQCGKPLDAQRPTARFCGPTCRSHAFRGKEPRR
jgi:hypothetical protein